MKRFMFLLAVKQHQRRKERKFNIAWFINLFHSDIDYCMEAWIAWKLENK